jgi:7-cyano-7-deazaguanine synthase
MAKDLAIVLNNGSLNSVVATTLAAQKHRPIMLFAETSANGLPRSRAAYEQQVAHFQPYREHLAPMSFLAQLESPAAANTQAIDPRQALALPPRLLELLPLVAIGARYAAHYQASALYLGLRVGAAADDLTQATEFIQVLNELIQLPCAQPELEIVAPLLELDPWQVVDVGYQANAPLEMSWSCVGQGSDPCWTCRGCRLREAAFEQAGKPDPLRTGKKFQGEGE